MVLLDPFYICLTRRINGGHSGTSKKKEKKKKLGMYHEGLKLYKVYINDDPGLTLTYLLARSNWVTCTFEWGKLLFKSFSGGKLAAKGLY